MHDSETRTLFGYKLAKDIKNRNTRQKSLNHLLAEKERSLNFSAVGGDYHRRLRSPEKGTKRNPDKLTGAEKAIAEILVATVKRKTAQGVASPTIFLDIGGMLALSPSKIALTKEVRALVEQGKVGIVIQNLSIGRSEVLGFTREPIKTDDSITVQEQQIVHDALPLIHRIACRVADIRKQVIFLNDGRETRLNRIDIIHEMNSLGKHGYLNDLDYPRLAKLLDSAYGVLFAEPTSGVEWHETPPIQEPPENSTYRYHANMLGKEAIISFGFEKLILESKFQNFFWETKLFLALLGLNVLNEEINGISKYIFRSWEKNSPKKVFELWQSCLRVRKNRYDVFVRPEFHSYKPDLREAI